MNKVEEIIAKFSDSGKNVENEGGAILGKIEDLVMDSLLEGHEDFKVGVRQALGEISSSLNNSDFADKTIIKSCITRLNNLSGERYDFIQKSEFETWRTILADVINKLNALLDK